MTRSILGATLLALLASTAAAEEAPQQRPCQADIQRYCADARGDRQKMGQCMKAHFDDFSSACQARIKERENRPPGDGNGSWQHRPPADQQPASAPSAASATSG